MKGVRLDHLAQAMAMSPERRLELMNDLEAEDLARRPWFLDGIEQREFRDVYQGDLAMVFRVAMHGIPFWLVELAADELQLRLKCPRHEAYERLDYNLTMMNYRLPQMPRRCGPE